jgi:DNA-binding SARP family transcriptional activator/WD40 repeat protein/tRNA A-37 threonylcarbamoyl transferase component Bud32/energy-coupling factor transporter ATP-binding protein EcfA2
MNGLTDRAIINVVDYRVLGPLSARVQGEPRKLGGRRQQMVLAVLLSKSNEVMSQDKLIDSVWAGHPPDSANQTLHSYVSNLRKELGGGIDREGTGYVVHIDKDGLDSTRFEALVGQAREAVVTSPAAALGFASEALALWHGPAFGDLGGEPALTAEAMRLEELRLATLEIRVEADIAVGNHAAVIQELEALTTEHPFRERLWGFLMLSLYRAGRQADALRSYRELRRILGEELGIEPAAELQDLEEQILTQDPALDYAAPASSPVDRAARGYELREQIRETPFGILLRGFQGSVGREVAVLKLDEAIANDPSFIRRFETEMRSASELEHPHLVSIYDFWRDPEGAYLVTALPRGGVLREVLADQPWNLSSVVRIIDQVSSALDYLHRNGFVHGSLTTESILLDEDSNAYLSDVGLSALVPEQDHTQSPADDVAALAALAMSLLTGSEAEPGTKLSELQPDLADLDALFSRAFHDDPASRFQKPEEFRRALRQATGADVVPTGQEVLSGSRRNPYKGLRAFKESEAGDFHGRDALVEELVETVASSRLIAVVGPSGSGKSSLVRAGLLPALRSGAIEGSMKWLVAEMFPGTHPFEELEGALVRVATERPSGLFDELTADRRGLGRAAKRIIGNDEDQLVIVVDQFEELFSLVTSETNRRLFLESLTAVATDERSRIRVILTLRADFFDQPLQYPEFAEAMNSGLVPISPPTEEGLTRAIAQPARGVGVDLQPGLITRIIDDVRDEPGGLPLMQYALTELFNKRVNNTMTMAAYEESGGVAGALANRADEIYGDLSDDGRVAARNLFLRLVNVDELADDTRRRVRQTELKGLGINQAILDDVIQQFGAFRLLSFDRDAATRTPTVEVAHEALIREWARLRTWIDDRREDLLIHRRIQVTARDWEESGKDQSYLLRGSRLEQALIWQERTDLAISDDEMAFIEASIEQERRDQAEHQALEDKAVRRRKAVIGALVGGLVVAGILGLVAFDRAQKARVTAAVATSGELSSAAMLAVEEDAELGVLLALEAIDATAELGLEPTPEAASALRDTLRRLRVTLRLPGGYQAVAYSPDGSVIATDNEVAGTIQLWDRESSEAIAAWDVSMEPSLPPGEVIAFEYSAAGDLLAASWEDPAMGSGDAEPIGVDQMVAVSLHDPLTLEVVGRLVGERGKYGSPTLSSGGFVAAAMFNLSHEPLGYVWDSATGEVVLIVGRDALTVMSAEFIPGTDILVVAHSAEPDTLGRLVAIDLNTFEEIWTIELDIDPGALSVAVSPDGTKVAIGEVDTKRLQIWDITTTEKLLDTLHNDPLALTWDSDGVRLAVSGNDSDITIFDESVGWEPVLVLTGHQSTVWSTDFHPTLDRFVSASLDGSALEWDISDAGAVGDRAISVGGEVGQFFFGSDPGRMIVGVLGFGARSIDMATGSIEVDLPHPDHLHFRPNDRITTVAGWIGQAPEERGALIDAGTGEVTRIFSDCLIPMAISPDESVVVIDSGFLCGVESVVPSQVLDVSSDEVLIDLRERFIFTAAFSPEGTFDGHEYVVVNVANADIEIYSLSDRRLITSYSMEDLGVSGFLTVDLDPQGRYLGLGVTGPEAVVIDMAAIFDGVPKMDAVVLNVEAHKGATPQVRVTSSGIAASAAFDGFYRVWDMETDEMLFEIREPEIVAQGAARFTWDGLQLAYEDARGNIRFTPLDTMEVVAQARAALTRSLTDDECRQYLETDGCVD